MVINIDFIMSVTAKVTHLMRVPTVLLNSVATVITATAMGYYSATLEPHIRGVSTYLFFITLNDCNIVSISIFKYFFQVCTYYLHNNKLIKKRMLPRCFCKSFTN